MGDLTEYAKTDILRIPSQVLGKKILTPPPPPPFPPENPTSLRHTRRWSAEQKICILKIDCLWGNPLEKSQQGNSQQGNSQQGNPMGKSQSVVI